MPKATSLGVRFAIPEDESARFEDESEAPLEDVEIDEDPTKTPPRARGASTDSMEDSSSSSSSNEEESTSDPTEEKKTILQRIFSFKLLIGLLLVGFVIFVIIDSTTTKHVRSGVEIFLDWIEDNPVEGFFVFVLGESYSLNPKVSRSRQWCCSPALSCLAETVYLAATVLFVPGAVLTLGAGFVFSMAFGLGGGVALGSLSVFLGASLGAIASFLLGRFLLRGQIEKLSKKYVTFQAIDNALKDNGLKIFVLLRLSPIIPFNVINYIAGVSSVSFRDYVLALFAIIPGTVLYVFLGASAGSLADSASSGGDPTVTIIIVVIGAVFGILAIWLTTRYARQELNKVLEDRRRAEADGEHPSICKSQTTDSNDSVR